MEITLKNIGIIENSTIKIDGLTVIAGNNNSGKSTIGKATYSLFEATSKISSKFFNDQQIYLKNNSKILLFFLIQLQDEIQRNFKKELKEEIKLINDNFLIENNITTLEQVIDTLSQIKNNVKKNKNPKTSYLIEKIDNILDKAEEIIENSDLEKNQNTFIQQNIEKKLQDVFSNQIAPYKKSSVLSEITIKDNQTVFNISSNIKIKFNNIVASSNLSNMIDKFNNVFFIDNPFILDEPREEKKKATYIFRIETKTIINNDRFINHRKQLASILRLKEDNTVLEQMIDQENYNKHIKKIIKKINDILPGSFDFSDDEDFYIEDNFKLKFSNLATGSKLFAILKILIEKNKIDDNTLLILDEPEAHLHPEWQLTLAELLTVFVKEIGVKIILTTHSPNFLLAIETYMLKYQTEKQTNYYITEENENKFVDYRLVNDNLDLLYSKFANPFFDLQNLKDSLL